MTIFVIDKCLRNATIFNMIQRPKLHVKLEVLTILVYTLALLSSGTMDFGLNVINSKPKNDRMHLGLLG